MRTLVLSILWLLCAACLPAAPADEIWKLYKQGDTAQAAARGLEELKQQPEDIELRQVTGRALVESRQFAAALPHLEHVVRLDTRRSWQSAWALAYAGYAHFGLGEATKAAAALDASLRLHATRNAETFARQAQALLGFSAAFTNWIVLETARFRFHFSPSVAAAATNRFAEQHEAACGQINKFCEARLPKKIDYFVWNTSADAERAGLGKLGFARPEMTLVHATWNQTVGHEMTHVLCWHGFHPAQTTALINEGLAVFFDQTRRDRLATAQAAVRAAGLESVSIVELWSDLRAKADTVTYPVAGAWIDCLHARGGADRLQQLAREQTLDAARRIYGGELEKWIEEFEHDLRKP